MSSSDKLTGSADLSLPRRRRKTSPPVLVAAAALLLVAAAVPAGFILQRPTTLRIAVGPPGGEDQQVIQAMAQSFSREASAVNLSIVATSGPVDSMAALAAGKADLAVGRADEDMPDGTSSIAVMRKNVAVLWAPASGGRHAVRSESKPKIKTIADLAGRRVGVVGRTQVNATLFRVIIRESGVDPDGVKVAVFDAEHIGDMIRDTSVDAFMTVAPLDSKLTTEAILATARQRGEPIFLSIDVSEAIASRHLHYESEEIPASAFTVSPARPGDKVETVGVSHLIVAPKTLSETTIGTLTRQIFAAKPSLARDIRAAAKIEMPNTDKDAAIPAHPGAAAYIDGTERSFMDKYGDYVWGAVLLFSLLGTVTAAIRHFFKRDERRLNTLHRERLVAAISHVRTVDSLEELDAMQREADEILRETLAFYDDGALEEADLAAYNLVLGQFHHAVTDRRAALAGPSPNLARMRAG